MSSHSVRFSVIIPTFNSAETLGRAIESVLEQSWPAHEIIVVDDGSTDETREIAAGFGRSIHYLYQENAGVSAARNNGARMATGDWLAFLDADDWFFPDRLKWHAQWISEDPGLDFLTGDYEYQREDGSLISCSMERHPAGQRLLDQNSGEPRAVITADQLEDFVADHFGDTHTLSVPRDKFLTLGGYPLGFKVCEDVHLLTRLCAEAERVGVICEPLGVYLIHQNSATRSDPTTAQRENVRTLLNLAKLSHQFPNPVRRGVQRRLRTGRLNLAYALSKQGRRWEAIQAVLPSLVETPGLPSWRNLLSILVG
jgi:hypothetical protein